MASQMVVGWLHRQRAAFVHGEYFSNFTELLKSYKFIIIIILIDSFAFSVLSPPSRIRSFVQCSAVLQHFKKNVCFPDSVLVL